MPDPAPNPTNWTQIGLALIGFATVCVQLQCNHEKTAERQAENTRKIDETAAKVDEAKTAAAETKEAVSVKAAKVDAKLTAIETKIEKVPPAVAAEVKKDKEK